MSRYDRKKRRWRAKQQQARNEQRRLWAIQRRLAAVPVEVRMAEFRLLSITPIMSTNA